MRVSGSRSRQSVTLGSARFINFGSSLSLPFHQDDLPFRRFEANCPLCRSPPTPFAPVHVLSKNTATSRVSHSLIILCLLPPTTLPISAIAIAPFALQLFVFVCDPLSLLVGPSKINILLCNTALVFLLL